MVRKELFMANVFEQIMDNSHIRNVKEVSRPMCGECVCMCVCVGLCVVSVCACVCV